MDSRIHMETVLNRLRQLAQGTLRRVPRLMLTAVICGASLPVYAQGPPYSFSKLEVPGSVRTEASGINTSGQVVGTYHRPDGTVHGFLYDGASYATVDFPGASYSFLFGIGASGSTVGSYSLVDGIGPYHGLTQQGQNFATFDFPNRETDGRAVNAAGHVVGIYNTGFGTANSGYLKVGETYTSIDVPGAQHTYVFGINDAGKITGSYVAGDGSLRGFLRVGAAYSAISFPGATQTFAGGVNNSDTIVGWNRKGSNARHGYVLAGTRLRAFDVDFPGVASTEPVSINDAGQIVGNYFSPDCPNGCGFLATPRTGVLPSCDQKLTLQYTPGTLKMSFSLRTSTPYSWSVSVVALGATLPLWSGSLPAISPTLSFDVPFAFPAVGPVVGVSLLLNGAGEVVCSDFATINTGG